MICLHTFEDDLCLWKELVCYCGSLGFDNLEITNKTQKFASNASEDEEELVKKWRICL